jgi:nucleotide-binding universal stress UspA family protein
MTDRSDVQPGAASCHPPGFIRRILVPLDGSALAESVLPHALTIARAYDAELLLLRVVGNGAGMPSSLSGQPVEWRLRHLEAERYLEEIESDLERSSARVARRLAVGKASEHILSVARAARMDLIVLSTHGIGGLTQFKLSGTASKVLSSADCSVLLVGATEGARRQPATYSRVLVPLDGSKRADWAACIAAPLARAARAELVLVHVVRRPDVIGEVTPDSEACRLADRLVEVNTKAAHQHLERECANLAGPDLRVRWRVEADSNISHVLERVAEQELASLVVVSAHGHSPSTGWPYGTVVSTLLAHGSRPILVLQDVPQRPMHEQPRSMAEAGPRRRQVEAT